MGNEEAQVSKWNPKTGSGRQEGDAIGATSERGYSIAFRLVLLEGIIVK